MGGGSQGPWIFLSSVLKCRTRLGYLRYLVHKFCQKSNVKDFFVPYKSFEQFPFYRKWQKFISRLFPFNLIELPNRLKKPSWKWLSATFYLAAVFLIIEWTSCLKVSWYHTFFLHWSTCTWNVMYNSCIVALFL